MRPTLVQMGWSPEAAAALVAPEPPRDPFLDALSSVRNPPSSSSPAVDDPFLSALTDIRAKSEEPSGPSLSQQVLRTGLRVGGGILGSVAGGLAGAATLNPAGVLAGGILGGGIGSGLGELGANGWSAGSRPCSRAHQSDQVATQTAIGAIPISRAKAGLSLVQAGMRQAGKGLRWPAVRTSRPTSPKGNPQHSPAWLAPRCSARSWAAALVRRRIVPVVRRSERRPPHRDICEQRPASWLARAGLRLVSARRFRWRQRLMDRDVRSVPGDMRGVR